MPRKNKKSYNKYMKKYMNNNRISTRSRSEIINRVLDIMSEGKLTSSNLIEINVLFWVLKKTRSEKC
jgi:Iap family predicted aminopeptidase